MAENAGAILRLDDARRDDRELRLVALVPHEIDAIAEAVRVSERRLDAVDRHLPRAHGLARAALRPQPQTLQHMRRVFVESEARDVADGKAHV